MKTIKYQNANNMPVDMKNELLEAAHAGQAESVFNKWADIFYVEPRSRSSVWMSIE